MKRKKHTTAMLLISALLLGTFIWFIERDSESSHRHKQRTHTLFAAYPDSIRLIQMERAGSLIECSKESGKWRMVRPADAPVNTTIIEKMIAGMAAVERGALITAEALAARSLSPADYGFDAPRARITFQNDRGTFTWLIGRDAPLGNALYVMEEGGGDIISTAQTLLNLVPEDPAWIRDRTLFSTKAAAVRGIDLRRDAGFLRLRQEKEANWRMEQPHAGRAALPGMNALIDHILSARIETFITDEKADLTVYGLHEPRTELTLFNKEEQTQTLLIGKDVPDHPETLYAKWADRDAVFTVSTEWAAGFELNSETLRSRQLIDEPLENIRSVQIAYGELTVELLQTNKEWIITRPARWPAESESVELLLETLCGSIIDSFADAPDQEQRRLIQETPWTITLSNSGASHTLRIASEGEQRLIQKDSDPSLYITAAGILPDAFADPLFYRNRTVLQIEPDSISAVSLTTGDAEYRVEKLDGQFAAPVRTQKPDLAALNELTAELSALRTGRYVVYNPDSLAPYGLDQPAARLSISLNRTNLLGQVVLLGSPAGTGRYAMLQGQNIVFVLPRKSAQVLTRELTQPIEKDVKEIVEQP
jgi:hypothetical protein